MSQYMRRMKRLCKKDRFAELLPVLEYWEDEELYLLEGPALGCMLICQPTNGGNDEILNGLTNLYKTELPEDTLIQASLVSLPDVEDQLYGYRMRRGFRNTSNQERKEGVTDQEQYDVIEDSIVDFFRNGSQEPINDRGFLLRNFEFWFTIRMPIREIKPTERELKAFKDIKSRVMRSLSLFAPYVAEERHYRRRMRILTGMFDKTGWNGKPLHLDKTQSSHELRELCLEPGKWVDVRPQGIAVMNGAGEETQFIKTMSITEMPETLFYGQMLDLVGDWLHGQAQGLHEHFIMTLNIHFPDQRKEKADFQKKRTFISNQAKGPVIQYLDRLRFQFKDFNTLNRELDQERSALVKYSLQMTVFAKTEARAKEFAEEAKSQFERKKVHLVEDSHFTLPFFIAALPMGLNLEFVKHSARFYLCSSKALPHMTPHIASWKGNCAHPTIMMASRLGQVVNIDPFKSDTNYNIFVAATSGAGKSFFTGYFINNFLASGPNLQEAPHVQKNNFDDGGQAFVIDVGRSYEGLAAQFASAQFLVFSGDMPFSLNPFLYVHEFAGKEGQGIMVLNMLKTMAAPSGKISDLQSSELLVILERVWNNYGQKAMIDNVVDECMASEYEEVRAIGIQLRPYKNDGYYSEYFTNAKPPINFDSRLVVIELEELKSDQQLQTVVLMCVIMSIQQAMYLSGTKRQKLFTLDESWEYLKGDENTKARLGFFAQFLETAWRRLRKYNAAGMMVTQSLRDGYQSDIGRAIMENSAWKFLLKQNSEVVDRMEDEKMYSGSKLDYKMLKSVHTVQPKPDITDNAYSEILIDHAGIKQVCRLYTDRTIQLLLTTRGDEKEQRKVLMEQGMTLPEAVRHMVRTEKERRSR